MEGDIERACDICKDLVTKDPVSEEDGVLGSSSVAAKRSRQDWKCQQPNAFAVVARMAEEEGQGEMEAVSELVTTSCDHIFHRSCLFEYWMKRKKKCPICRHPNKITLKKLTREPQTSEQHCEHCTKMRMEVTAAQVEKDSANVRAAECEMKELEWRKLYAAVVNGKEGWRDKLDKVGSQKLVVDTTLGDQTCSSTLQQAQLLREVELLELKKRGEWEEREKILRAQVNRLQKENDRRASEQLKRETLPDSATQVPYWKRLCQLKERKMEKYRKERDYERDRANLFQELWKQEKKREEENSEDDEGKESSWKSLLTSGRTENQTRILSLMHQDLQLSESDEEINNQVRVSTGLVDDDPDVPRNSDPERMGGLLSLPLKTENSFNNAQQSQPIVTIDISSPSPHHVTSYDIITLDGSDEENNEDQVRTETRGVVNNDDDESRNRQRSTVIIDHRIQTVLAPHLSSSSSNPTPAPTENTCAYQ